MLASLLLALAAIAVRLADMLARHAQRLGAVEIVAFAACPYCYTSDADCFTYAPCCPGCDHLPMRTLTRA